MLPPDGQRGLPRGARGCEGGAQPLQEAETPTHTARVGGTEVLPSHGARALTRSACRRLACSQVSERPNDDATPYATKYEAREILVCMHAFPIPHLQARVRV